MKKIIFTLIAVILSTLLSAQTIVEKHGLLKVKGSHVVNKDEQFISLCGNSLFWSTNGWGGEKYYNGDVVKFLKDDWNSSIVRAAMAVEGSGGYISDPAGQIAKVKTVVDACIENGLYVIIDFHSHSAENYSNQAVTFFQEMARTYGTYDNVIYEIYNEPLNVSWSGVIKPYAQKVIDAIRAIDPDNLIIVGTRNWSQDVVEASLNPIKDDNVAYALHFYAGTHTQWLRDAAMTAMNNGIAIFITEWGTCDASGNGGYNEVSSDVWMNFCQDNFISVCNWALNDKTETASVLKPGASIRGGWTDDDYTVSGKYVRNLMRNWPTEGKPCNAVLLPNTIKAADYCRQLGIQTDVCSEGGRNVTNIATGKWMTYRVSVETAGEYTISYRVAAPSKGGKIQLDAGDETVIFDTISIPATGGRQNWTTVWHDITLPEGIYDIRLLALTGGFSVNWIKIMHKTEGTPVLKEITLFSPSDVVAINTSHRLVAQGFDQNGNPYLIEPVWSIVYDKEGATIDQNGMFTAGKILDTYRVTVTQGDITVSTDITVIDPCPPTDITAGRIEAEDYCTANNIGTEPTTDTGGGINIGWLVSNSSWLTYTINVPETGVYNLDFRTASLASGGQLKMLVDGKEILTQNFPKTGAWQNFQTTTTAAFELTEGDHILRFNIVVGDFNINWFEFNKCDGCSTSINPLAGTLSVYPNPVQQGKHLHISSLSAINYVRMTDLRGVVVYTQPVDGKTYELSIPTDGLNGGVYLLQLVSEQNQEVYKVIVE
ncbi:MAG: cellulase family glycosylhydrolase [Bacteroidetes bacterium]|nr:cellulase family glycosylhydrolase [Bacteroidota bacterium]